MYSYHFCGQIQVSKIVVNECVLVKEFATTAIFYGCRISFWVCPANETMTTTTTTTHKRNNNINHSSTAKTQKMGGQMPCCFRHKLTEAEISGKMTNSMQQNEEKKNHQQLQTDQRKSRANTVFDVFFGS